MLRVFDKTARDLKHISVSQRCGCALVILPMVKPVLSQYLERSLFATVQRVRNLYVLILL